MFGTAEASSGLACWSGASIARTVVFRPGYRPSKTTPNNTAIYSDWRCAVAALRAIAGPKILLLDPTDGALVVPPGFWDFGGGEVGWYLPLCRLVINLAPFPMPTPTILTVQDRVWSGGAYPQRV